MNARSRTATVAGVFYLITEMSAIAGLLLYEPALTEALYLAGDGADTRVQLVALCGFILIVAHLGTIGTLSPVVKRYRESAALGAAETLLAACHNSRMRCTTMTSAQPQASQHGLRP
jgi:hypothetical protein